MQLLYHRLETICYFWVKWLTSSCAIDSTVINTVPIWFRKNLTVCRLSRSAFYPGLNWSVLMYMHGVSYSVSPTVNPLQLLMNVISIQHLPTSRRWCAQCNNLAHDMDSFPQRSSIFFQWTSTRMFLSLHWAWGENKKIERRESVSAAPKVSLSKLYISRDECLLFIPDKSNVLQSSP